ncbi:hypothetical protein ACFYT3_23470 [Nocardia amikacinitolerans]|uniref:hypothetical protein n=1 Tax=Nocardia amikacinitolerans TaxID=756689 RepID=UPI00367F05B2
MGVLVIDWQTYYDAAKKCHDLAADLRTADKPVHDALKGECVGMAGDTAGCEKWAAAQSIDRRLAMDVGGSLRYSGQSFINFRNYEFAEGGSHRFRWIDLKKFELQSPELGDRSILEALTSTPEFPDDYVGGGIDPEGLRHGPYWLDRISADAYQLTERSSALDLLERWLAGCGVIPQSLRIEVDRQVLDPIRQSTSCYVLEELGDSAANDYADIHVEFHEIVVIDRVEKHVVLVVATDD